MAKIALAASGTKSSLLSEEFVLKMNNGYYWIRHLMLFSDLENLLSVWRICYQLGESYLNVFLLHDIENL